MGSIHCVGLMHAQAAIIEAQNGALMRLWMSLGGSMSTSPRDEGAGMSGQDAAGIVGEQSSDEGVRLEEATHPSKMQTRIT